MNKLISKMMVCLVAVAVLGSGCSKGKKGQDGSDNLAQEAVTLFTPGTYQGFGNGYGGEVWVEVVLAADAIEQITVTQHQETKGIGTTAVDQLPQMMINKQSLAVDTIAGCTVTSQALLVAVEDAIKDVCTDMPRMYRTVETEPEAWVLEEMQTQVLVIGGGGSGLAAAIAASNAGAKVVLMEKMPFLGGAASVSGGQINAGGSEYQKAHGIVDDSPDLLAADLLAGGHDQNDQTLVNLYSNAAGATFDWLVNSVGMRFEADVVSTPEHSTDRIFIAEGKAAGMNAALLGALEASDTQVILDARVSKLLIEDGKVVGASAVSTIGSKAYEVKADVVIMATGGFGNNKTLLPESLQTMLYYGPVSSTGDGLLMLQSLEPRTQMMDYGKIYPNGIESEPGKARSTVSATTAVLQQTSAILVDRNGKRVVNEVGSYADIRDQLMAQNDQTLFLVMDQAGFDLFKQRCQENNYATEAEIATWLSQNGKSSPIFANGSTLEAAAKAAGVDAAGLLEQIELFHKGIAAQEDEFGRTVANPFGTGPYYLVEQKPRFATTLGGVCINEQMEILTENGGTIPGLLAAGELVGGLHGDDSMPSVCISWAFTSGRLAGESAVKHILGEYQWSGTVPEAIPEEPAGVEVPSVDQPAA